MSRGGATAIYSNFWNMKFSNNEIKCLDFSKDVENWKLENITTHMVSK